MQVMRLQFYHRRLSNQPCNRVEAPHLCFILFSGEGKLPVSGQTLWCFSRNNIPMGTQDRWNTWGSCCFSRSKGNRNRRDVAFPAFKKKDGSSKPWIVTHGELSPGLSVVVMLKRSENYIASSNTWMIVISIRTIGMLSQKSCRQRDTSLGKNTQWQSSKTTQILVIISAGWREERRLSASQRRWSAFPWGCGMR